jgi:hypothetical protein
MEKKHYLLLVLFQVVPSPNGKKLQLFLEVKFLLPMPTVEVPKNTNTPEQERMQWS